MSNNIPTDIGDPIPADALHPVSFRLPTWEVVLGLADGEAWVTSKLRTGYPRFAIHPGVLPLYQKFEKDFGKEGEKCLVFPTYSIAYRCKEYVEKYSELPEKPIVRVVEITTVKSGSEISVSVVFVPETEFMVAKGYLRYAGEGISSRLGLYLSEGDEPWIEKKSSSNSPSYTSSLYSTKSKAIIKQRIIDITKQIGNKSELPDKINEINESDVYLYPTGMASLFYTHRAVNKIFGESNKSVLFGFAFTDTLKLMRRFGSGFHFFGYGETEDISKLQQLLETGEQIVGLFCEFPNNPLLKSPDLASIRKLADKYNFPVIVDDTLSNYVNLYVLPYADIVVCSLTKIFNGSCDAMGGSLLLNPRGKYYQALKQTLSEQFEDILWFEDANLLEKNSRDVLERAYKVNPNTEAVVSFLIKSPFIKHLYYPKLSPTKQFYDNFMVKGAGYGSLFSIQFHDPENAKKFYNALRIDKGPSLGTNFTLCCTFPYLAHFDEFDFVEPFGVDRNMIRFSIGLEDPVELLKKFQQALDACS